MKIRFAPSPHTALLTQEAIPLLLVGIFLVSFLESWGKTSQLRWSSVLPKRWGSISNRSWGIWYRLRYKSPMLKPEEPWIASLTGDVETGPGRPQPVTKAAGISQRNLSSAAPAFALNTMRSFWTSCWLEDDISGLPCSLYSVIFAVDSSLLLCFLQGNPVEGLRPDR